MFFLQRGIFAMNFYIWGTEMTGKSKQQIYNSFFSGWNSPCLLQPNKLHRGQNQSGHCPRKNIWQTWNLFAKSKQGPVRSQGPFCFGLMLFLAKRWKEFWSFRVTGNQGQGKILESGHPGQNRICHQSLSDDEVAEAKLKIKLLQEWKNSELDLYRTLSTTAWINGS